jgi:GNAT superfamily N-acetyltransferase
VSDADGRVTPAIRPAGLDDVAEIRSLLTEHHNDGPHPTVDIVGPYLRHLIATARALVAVDDGGVAGFGATVATGTGRHLTDLFVRTDRLGKGIGRPLLDAVFGDDWPRTTFASDDPRALPIYIRAGLVPLWPSLYLTGAATGLPDAEDEMTVESADAIVLADLERDWSGADRSIDHAFWASQADPDSFVVVDASGIVAAGHARARQIGTDRALDRLVIRPDRDPLGPIVAALRRAARGGRVRACLPGPNPAVRPLLEAGFHIEDRDTYMASRPDLVDPGRLLPNPGML